MKSYVIHQMLPFSVTLNYL